MGLVSFAEQALARSMPGQADSIPSASNPSEQTQASAPPAESHTAPMPPEPPEAGGGDSTAASGAAQEGGLFVNHASSATPKQVTSYVVILHRLNMVEIPLSSALCHMWHS